MSCDPVVPAFKFSQEESEELSDLILSFLAKHLTEEVVLGLDIEVDFRFAPKVKELNERNVVKAFAKVAGGTCTDGPPHPFCRNFPQKHWQ
jgi:hypothetical protein